MKSSHAFSSPILMVLVVMLGMSKASGLCEDLDCDSTASEDASEYMSAIQLQVSTSKSEFDTDEECHGKCYIERFAGDRIISAFLQKTSLLAHQIRTQLYNDFRLSALITGQGTSAYVRVVVTLAIVSMLLAIGAFIFRRLRPEEYQNNAMWTTCHIQWLSIAAQVFESTSFLSLVTTSYDLAIDLGFDAAVSGGLLGAHFALAVPALFLCFRITTPWNPSLCWEVCFCSLATAGVAQFCFAAFTMTSSGLHVHKTGRLVILILLRAVAGFGTTCFSSIAKLMAQKVTPKQEMLNYQVLYQSGVTIGLALGPLLSSSVNVAAGAHSIASQCGCPIIVNGFFAILMALSFWFLVPIDLKDSVDAKAKRDASFDTQLSASTSSTSSSGDEYLSARKTIWWIAVVYDFERCVSQVAIEVAASLVLETELGWSPTVIGCIVGCGFLMNVPANEVFLSARQWSKVSDGQVARCSAVVGAVATLLLWPGLGSLLFNTDAVTIMLAEIFMFTSLRISKPILDAVATHAAIPNTLYSQANCLILQRLLNFSVGRVFTPILTRWSIEAFGRKFYCLAQLCLCTLGCMSIFKGMQAAKTMGYFS